MQPPKKLEEKVQEQVKADLQDEHWAHCQGGVPPLDGAVVSR